MLLSVSNSRTLSSTSRSSGAKISGTKPLRLALPRYRAVKPDISIEQIQLSDVNVGEIATPSPTCFMQSQTVK